MILIRRSVFLSKNVIRNTPSSYFQRAIAIKNPIMGQEKFSMRDKLKIQHEETEAETLEFRESPRVISELFPLYDHEVHQTKNLKELQKLILMKSKSLTLTQNIAILQKMHVLLYDEKWTKNQKKELINSIELHILLGHLKKNLQKVEINDLVNSLIFFTKIELPIHSQLMMEILEQLKNNADKITFIKSCMLYHYLVKQKLDQQFQRILRINIEKFIKSHLQSAREDEIAKAVYYGSICDFSIASMVQILDVLLTIQVSEMSVWIENEILGNAFKLLIRVKNHETYLDLEKRYFEKLDELKNDRICVQNFCHFIYVYGNHVLAEKTDYKENLVDDIIDLIMEGKIFTTKKLLCLEGLASMKHVRHDFIKNTKNSVLQEKQFVNKSGEYFAAFVRGLAESNYFIVKPEDLDPVKTYVETLEVYNSTREMRRLGFDKKASAAVDLLSVGIYPLRFLENLSKDFDSKTDLLNCHGGKLQIALLINEALSVFHTPYKRSFLSEQTFFSIINTLNSIKTLMHEEKEKWLSSIKEVLEASENKENCLLENCRTRYGQEIHFAVAVNERGEVFNFQPTGDKINIIENIDIPPDYSLVLINFVPKTGYNRNVPTLGSYYTLKLNILRAMGYRTLTILSHEWTNLPENERGNYFWSRVRTETEDLVFENSKKIVGKEEIMEETKSKKKKKENRELECNSS